MDGSFRYAPTRGQVRRVGRQNEDSGVTQRPLHLQQPPNAADAVARSFQPLHALVEEGQVLVDVGDEAALLNKLGEELGGQQQAVEGLVGLVAGSEEARGCRTWIRGTKGLVIRC